MERFHHESGSPKDNAQRNLIGRTHYVDDDTLKGFNSRIVHAEVYAGGLLFGLIESVPNPRGTSTRGFREVIFDVTGKVLTPCYAADEGIWDSKKRAEIKLAELVSEMDVCAVTDEAIARERRAIDLFEESLEPVDAIK